MELTVDKLVESDDVFTGSMESVEVVEELERRRRLVAEGKSRLLNEEESWELLRSSGCHV